MLAPLQQQIRKTQQLLARAQRIAYDVQQIEREFGAAVQGHRSDRQPARDGPRRGRALANSVAAFEDALKVQAGAVSNIEGARTLCKDLVTASQSATGALQAAQAGNQLLALQSQQLADLTATVASLGRAQSLDAANAARPRRRPASSSAASSRPDAATSHHRPDVPELRRWTPSSSRGSEPGRSSPSR
jgi:P-type conjugative transfer protein TrbJ